jgi:hypothetical protein
MAADTGVLEAILKRIQTLQGMQDSRGPQGIYSRGKNVYNAASLAAQRGAPLQYGRIPYQGPIQGAASRRLFNG